MKIEDVACKDIAIHCRNKTELRKLLRELTYRGYRWDGNGKPAGSCSPYAIYKGSTCIEILKNNRILYSNIKYFKRIDYTIVEFSELELED